MRTFLLALSLCLITGLAACKTTEKEIAPPAQEAEKTPPPPSDVVTPPAPVELSVEGELQSVDLTAKTLVIKDATGAERKFTFTDSTGILGASGAQGLAGRKGSPIKIGYVMQGDVNSAVWIEVSSAKKDAERK